MVQFKYIICPTNMVHPKHLLLLLLLLLLSSFLTICSVAITNITTDQLALLALKDRITELPTHHILAKNWTAGSWVCDWIGVSCGSSRHLRVTALNISDMNLTGTLPPHLGNLSFLVSLVIRDNNFQGELPDEVSRLRRLRVLDLTDNHFSGQFPPWIGSFQELECLSFRNNSFTGVIPQSISNMSKLTVLGLSYNKLQGNFPAEVFNITSLETIGLSENGFSDGSSLPDDMCLRLPRLKLLHLERVGLIGQIPSSIGHCLQLEILYLNWNSLTGEIPKEVGNLSMLQRLAIDHNNLTGSIPKELGNLSMAQVVYLKSNILKGTIPEEIGKLYNLQYLDFSYNELIGSIPTDIFNISTIIVIELNNNFLSGNLPSTMCYNLPNLDGLYLFTNSIGGAIPNSISNCSNLQALVIAENNFTGSIPNSLGDLKLLRGLYLHTNDLTSDPSSHVLNFIAPLANLKILTLSYNPLDGVFPDSIGNVSSILEEIYACECELRGAVPSWIGNLSNLNTLYLSYNQLIGSLPNSMKNWQNLQRLYLGGNNMSISLQHFCACKKLGELELDENLIIEGAIPDCLGNVTSLRYLYLYSTGINSSLPASLWKLNDLLELNISSNSLTGSIPPEINNLKMATSIDFSTNYFSSDIPSSIGDMQALGDLSLDHNQFQGHIPETISQMLSLKRLDLSHNLLTGTIPMSLDKLRDLNFFNVSFNNLSGEIPSRGPFTNLHAESFLGNQALCGAQRFHVPPCSSHSAHPRMSSRYVHKVVIILVLTMSIAGISSLGFIYLKCKRKGKTITRDGENFSMITYQRISYYELLRATDRYNQNNLLGTGSSGSVYKGILEDGNIVAVKVFNLQLERSFERFDMECEVLRNLRHRNLAKVISNCSNPDFKALVVEYMRNGSLDNWLHSNNHFLNVMQRMNILIDVACALQYLHCGNLVPIAHCDLKPSNVLLDEEMVGHVCDFGISKMLGMENSITYTNTLATLCYLAPEYASEGLVSVRCDIYSFGIMIMEVFTGKSPTDEMFGENLNLRSWVQESMPDRLANVIDSGLFSTFNDHSADIVACISSIMDVSLTCTNVSPRERSNIEEVLASLNKIRLQLLPYTVQINS